MMSGKKRYEKITCCRTKRPLTKALSEQTKIILKLGGCEGSTEDSEKTAVFSQKWTSKAILCTYIHTYAHTCVFSRPTNANLKNLSEFNMKS
jgi:hypothetical protein